MSWIGWLFLAAGLFLLIVLARGVVQLLIWLVMEFIVRPRELAHRQEELNQRNREPKPPPPSGKADRKVPAEKPKPVVRPPVRQPTIARGPSRLGRLLKSLEITLVPRGYDHWVASALAEEDPAMKVRYLSKALKLDPTYSPALGLMGSALLSLEKYSEAIAWFDRSIDAHPTALAWHRKGICCHRLGRRDEALRCFNKALETCPAEDRPLREDAERMRRLAESEEAGSHAAMRGP
jgi:tetratricopeptide (TPR) repeat protein